MFRPLNHLPNIRSRRLASVRRFGDDENGAAYTLSYVMVVPVYALLMCLIVETGLMLTAKLGTVYSAYAAARTASVWSSATTWDNTMKKSKKAAIKTMTPFASGLQPLTSTATTPSALPDAAIYVAAYERFAEKPASRKYLLSKYGYAAGHTKVTIQGPPKSWKDDITATVTYEFPFNVPGIGRLLGQRGRDGRFYFSLTSQVTLPNEAPQDDRKTIGIGYGTLE